MASKETPGMFDAAVTTAREIGLLPKPQTPHDLSKEALERLIEPIGGLERMRQYVSTLVVTLHNRDQLLKGMTPEEQAALINEFYVIIVPPIFDKAGHVDYFMPQTASLIAQFGTPIPRPAHALEAVHAAFEIQTRIHAANEQRRMENKLPFIFGIGIDTGEAMAGNLGTQDTYLQYTITGKPVDMAWIIGGLTKDYKAEIVIGEETYKRLHGLEVREPHPIIDHANPTQARIVYPVVGLQGATQ